MTTMVGFTLTFAEVSEELRQQYEHLVPGTIVFGAVMPDGQVYVHEPIVDTFGSLGDAQEHFPDALVAVSGPVVPTSYMRLRLEQDHQRLQQRQQEEHDLALHMLDECDAMAARYWKIQTEKESA